MRQSSRSDAKNYKEESGSEAEDDDDEVFDYYEFVFSINTQQQVYLNMQNKSTVNDFTQIASILMVNWLFCLFSCLFPVSIMSLLSKSELTRKQTL